MNNKLLLQDLTDQLAEAGKIKKKDAEEFLRAFFKVSEDALFEDGIVKIHGLGTLKLVLVDARKSVNVSTGEEFEIREHYKVSFIPDADLKNSVNQPYSHLEPVELDGVAESNAPIVDKKSVTLKEKTSNPNSNKQEKIKKDSPKGLKKNRRSTVAWILFFLLIILLGVWSWISNDKRRKENAVKINEIELIDSLEADATLQQDLAALAQESDTTLKSTADDSLESVVESVANETGPAKPASADVVSKPEIAKQTTTIAKTTTSAVKPTTPAVKPTTPAVKPTTPAVKPTTPAVKPTTPAVKPTTPTVKSTSPAVKPTSPAVKPTTPVTKSAAPVAKPADNKSSVATKQLATSTLTSTVTPKKTTTNTAEPAVKLSSTAVSTEYIATVVLKPGDRLNLLALKYYGDKVFWVYIYQANKSVIPNPDNVPTGTTIRVPKADPKLIDPKNPALIAKAKALQLQYIGAQ